MNRKGFTLIEVIVVIVIIVLLSLILIPNVMLFVSKNDKDMCEKLKDNIISAAEMYVSENKYELGFGCDSIKTIKLGDLITAGKISSPVINPVTKKELSGDVVVEVKYSCTNRKFEYSIKSDISSDISCEKN